MTWGWLVRRYPRDLRRHVAGRDLLAFPTAGGLYYWAAKLAPGKSGPIWSWFTGWFNLLGQVAVTAGISFGCAFSISAFLCQLHRRRRVARARRYTIGILAVVLFIQGLLNTFSVKLVALLNDVSVCWHLVGVALIVVLLFWAPESGSHQSLGVRVRQRGLEGVRGALRLHHRLCTSSRSAC